MLVVSVGVLGVCGINWCCMCCGVCRCWTFRAVTVVSVGVCGVREYSIMVLSGVVGVAGESRRLWC